RQEDAGESASPQFAEEAEAKELVAGFGHGGERFGQPVCRLGIAAMNIAEKLRVLRTGGVGVAPGFEQIDAVTGMRGAVITVRAAGLRQGGAPVGNGRQRQRRRPGQRLAVTPGWLVLPVSCWTGHRRRVFDEDDTEALLVFSRRWLLACQAAKPDFFQDN